MRQHAATLKQLFSFKGSDGKEPDASLIVASGILYGTTYGGGADDNGTVFSITTSGTQKVLHSFEGGTDGSLPLSSLLNVSGTFYGTTPNGGGPGDEGIAYAVTGSGKETVVHRFTGNPDGANPYAPLVNVSGTLYGTTAGGGANSAGTVFSIASSGAENVIYALGASSDDGSTPMAGLVNVGGTLYGTTAFGGANCGSVGCGTVFKISTSGTEKVIYSFKGGKDGSMPASELVDAKDTLYGTTLEGGGTANVGTVFSVTTSGKEKVLHSFQGGASDGAEPQGITDLNGTLYGTTSAGGKNNLGTIFSLTTSGTETLLYSFAGGTNGSTPRAGLSNVSGTLYGTTALGGANKVGTVFSITP
jgi:uncharacterized repeat protein (TIGR03803 family)